MPTFLTHALLGGIGVAILCGPLGCLVIWQRMAYFGATLAHAALLGVALGLILHINLQLAITLVSLATAALLTLATRRPHLSTDTLLGILAHATLALGLLLITTLPGVSIDIEAYLFGDILAITPRDLLWIYLGGAAILITLAAIWRPLISLITDRDLAVVDGINETKIRAIFFLTISVFVAIAIQIVGILLIVSLLIIPAATARHPTRSPETMAALATAFAILATTTGLALSLLLDTPPGPSIVVSATAVFALTLLIRVRSSG